MKERIVVKRASATTAVSAPAKEFIFTEDMVPALAKDWQGSDYIRQYRQQAWDNYLKAPMPNPTDEAWRRTDIHTLNVGAFRLVDKNEAIQVPPDELLAPLAGDSHGGQIVITPQGTKTDLANELSQSGVIFTDLATAEREHPEILEKILGKIVRNDEGKFASLAAAMAQFGVLVYVPRNVHVDAPLHSVLWGPGEEKAYFSHILVYLDDGASATYVHEAASPKEGKSQTLHAGLVEILVGENARLYFVELQSWGENVWNFSHERVRVERDGTIDWIFGAIGSRMTKNFSDLDLAGQGSTGRMSGFYFTDGVQHLDHDTQQNHLAPNTTSDLLFKGALKDKSRSVWQGMIYVAPGAQKTDGYQANRNLVLSNQARADSIPGLEILADDVRCTHGATVGKIDENQVFYLRSRGLPYEDAEHLIVEGFFDPIMQRIPFEGVRARFQQSIQNKLR
jgi:Fe-S cluster assembly protein SufD